MKKGVSLVAVLLAVIAAVSIGWNIYQTLEMRQLRAELDEAHAARTAGMAPSNPSLIGAVDESEKQPSAGSETAPAVGPAGNDVEQGNDPFAGMTPEALRQMMSSPSMQEIIRVQQEGMMKYFYGDLLAWLDLPEDQAKEFMEMLVDYQLTGMDTAFEAMDPALSQEDRVKLLNQIKEEKDLAKEQIHAYLGDAERVEYFEAYNESLPEQIQVSDLRKLLADSGSPLSSEQEQELLNTIYDARTGFPFDHDFTNQEKIDPTQVTQANLERYTQQYQQLQDQVRDQAGQILTAEQLETFAKAQEQQRAMQQMGLQWMSRLFGGSGESSQ
ncbi:MAG TPA: hypothetical protein VMN36_18110 [Verrucomicrobiales bacterium]|nr:hypothetical protein [Verrucomicrobiales bacterium]